MTDERKEERAIEQALSQSMATGNEPRLLRGGEGADAAMVREYTEILGLLPYELPAEAPPVHLKAQIMDRIRFDSGTPAAPGSATSDAATSQHGEATEIPRIPPDTNFRPATRQPWQSFAIAAMFALCLLGLGFTGGIVWKQSQQIDRLNGQLALATTTPYQGELLQAQQEAISLRDRLDMITTVARQAYPMREVSHTGLQTQPKGVVYVCGQHQRWYVHLRGLEPPEEDEEYHLWFVTDAGQVDGGILEVRPDTSSEKESLSMPAGTRGFLVTLEQIGSRSEPEGLTVLLGEQPINL